LYVSNTSSTAPGGKVMTFSGVASSRLGSSPGATPLKGAGTPP
jgi:hypothetical protein